MAPLIVSDGASLEALGGGAAATLELVPRGCRLQTYKQRPVPTFRVTGEMIAYASPDSTYAVTRRLLDSARREIIIGIYDFSADYMKDILLNALARGVKVSLMLDIDGAKEEQLFEELRKFGCQAVPAPSCAGRAAHFFPSSHEKVIVIDRTWTLVQSGNYSKNSIPFNEKDGGDDANFVTGNRDMGVAVRSKPLAEFFADVLRSDMKLELDAAGAESLTVPARRAEPDLVEAAPAQSPAKRFKSRSFNPPGKVVVTPVLTPDNYMEVVPGFLESATRSILIEQQYIRSTHAEVIKLLAAIKAARGRNPSLDVRIILGKLFDADDFKQEQKNVANLNKAFGLTLGTNIRYIDLKRFVHCHNKLVVVDKAAALVSSQNWSNTGVGTNREAGLIIRHAPLARYYAEIFESDWATALQAIPNPGKKQTIAPEALARGNFIQVVAADFQEV